MSAFEHYNKQKKKKKKQEITVLTVNGKDKTSRKENEVQASTPLPQSMFPATPTDVVPAVRNVFLSPILSTGHKQRERMQQNISATSENENNCRKTEDSTPVLNSSRRNRASKKNRASTNSPSDNQTNGAIPPSPGKSSDTPKEKTNLKRRKLSDGAVKSKKCRVESKETVNEEAANFAIDSVTEGRQMLQWIMSPLDVDVFFESYWENQPLHITGRTDYFKDVCSIDDLDQVFRKCPINFMKNVTVTAYEDGERRTVELPGRARPNAVWDLYKRGHSIRILNPQTFVPNVGTIVAALQEHFHCMVGVNSYLTPAGTQGFAPHYDDIEAFVLQMEGQKEWKVYPPRSENEKLPRYSSPDFQQDEIGSPVLEVTLKPGDLLYFPRGWIHQARSVENHHSLHLTVSTYQCNSWGDFFKTALPFALEQAIESEVELRKGIPLCLTELLGTMAGRTAGRDLILARANQLFGKILQHVPWDVAGDEIAKEFIHSSFPPQHEDLDKKTWEKLCSRKKKTSVKLVTANACRVVAESDERLVVYYSTDNSLEPRREELMGFEVSQEEASVLAQLQEIYPRYVRVRNLALLAKTTLEAVTDLVFNLGQRALLRVKPPKVSKSIN